MNAAEMITELQKLAPDTEIVTYESDYDTMRVYRYEANISGATIILGKILDSWHDFENEDD